MFRLSLFRIRAFTAGNAASFLGSVGRGGMQFMADDLGSRASGCPRHGYSFTQTPLWAGIFMIPSWPASCLRALSGKLSDKYGARPFCDRWNAALWERCTR